MILTYRQDDILLIKLPLKLPLIRFFLSYWETDGLSTDLILINVVSTISNLHQPILYKTTYQRESQLTKAILTFITWQPAIAQLLLQTVVGRLTFPLGEVVDDRVADHDDHNGDVRDQVVRQGVLQLRTASLQQTRLP